MALPILQHIPRNESLSPTSRFLLCPFFTLFPVFLGQFRLKFQSLCHSPTSRYKMLWDQPNLKLVSRHPHPITWFYQKIHAYYLYYMWLTSQHIRSYCKCLWDVFGLSSNIYKNMPMTTIVLKLRFLGQVSPEVQHGNPIAIDLHHKEPQKPIKIAKV